MTLLILVAQVCQQLKKMILDNRLLAIREFVDDVGISLCQAIFADVLGMKPVAAKIVPNLLNFEQNQLRMELAQYK